jgi:hypothetical protein
MEIILLIPNCNLLRWDVYLGNYAPWLTFNRVRLNPLKPILRHAK